MLSLVKFILIEQILKSPLRIKHKNAKYTNSIIPPYFEDQQMAPILLYNVFLIP